MVEACGTDTGRVLDSGTRVGLEIRFHARELIPMPKPATSATARGGGAEGIAVRWVTGGRQLDIDGWSANSSGQRECDVFENMWPAKPSIHKIYDGLRGQRRKDPPGVKPLSRGRRGHPKPAVPRPRQEAVSRSLDDMACASSTARSVAAPLTHRPFVPGVSWP